MLVLPREAFLEAVADSFTFLFLLVPELLSALKRLLTVAAIDEDSPKYALNFLASFGGDGGTGCVGCFCNSSISR